MGLLLTQALSISRPSHSHFLIIFDLLTPLMPRPSGKKTKQNETKQSELTLSLRQGKAKSFIFKIMAKKKILLTMIKMVKTITVDFS